MKDLSPHELEAIVGHANALAVIFGQAIVCIITTDGDAFESFSPVENKALVREALGPKWADSQRYYVQP